jgi:aspartate racemase
MHVGMIVGIGPAATDYYYRLIIAELSRQGFPLELTMAHADTATLLRHQAAGDRQQQAAIYLRLTDRLKRCGVDCVAITSIAGHFCIDEFMAVSPLPVINLLDVVKAQVQAQGFKKLGLLGTRVVMESRFYGALEGVEVLPPVGGVAEVHEAYVAMASHGVVTPAQREVFIRAGRALSQEHGCEAIMLAGTDLALVFQEGSQYGFSVFDCARVHALAIAQAAITSC